LPKGNRGRSAWSSLPFADAPEAVKHSAGNVSGFAPSSLEVKTMASGQVIYEVEGKLGGKEHDIYLDAKGTILRQSTAITAKLNVDR
jgi:uncharacterized membrane protein YkoI